MSENKSDVAERLFLNGFACSQSVLLTYCEEYGLDKDTAKKISSTFGGGMGRLRKTCGALTGAFMVLGLERGNSIPNDMNKKLKSYKMVRTLNKRFKELHGETDCGKLLKKYSNRDDVKLREHHKNICHQLVNDTVCILEDIISENREDKNYV